MISLEPRLLSLHHRHFRNPSISLSSSLLLHLFSFSPLKHTLSPPSFRAPVLRSPGNSQLNDDVEDNFEGEDEHEEFVEYEGYESEATDENFLVDEDELQAEARVLVQQFSRSLSRELTIEDEVQVSKEAGGKQKCQKFVPKSIHDPLLPRGYSWKAKCA
ncbi:uncharacterized protein LOC141619385 [Silene latifolia]|uniref:uncharacterized protein LOC141619385 n=1 Tax=Silene latifolia TaxID=37657 RepID=UPI003D77D714